MSTAIELPTPIIIPVAGVSYRQGIVRTLSEGTRVILKRDRDNEFDENAVALYTLHGDHFGFAPRTVAERLVADGCERWGGEISEVYRRETWGVRVRVTHSNVRDYPTKPKHTSFIQPVPAELEDIETPDGIDSPVVFSKSGRQLGLAVDYDAEATTVKVTTGDGEQRLFPATAVIVKEPSEVH